MALARLDPEVLAALRSKPAVPKRSAQQRIPLAERQADAQLSRCRILAEAVTFASKALAHAGARLQKGAQGFRTTEAGDVPLAEACRGLIQACGGMGAAFTLLAGTMVGEILEPLQDVQRSIEDERARRRTGLNALEQDEARIVKLQSESAKKRDKVNEELQTQMRERHEVERRGGWFMRRTLLGKMGRQIERTAQLQSQAVEDLARRSDQVAVVKQRTAEGSQELREMLIQADARLKKVLQPLLHGCAHAWQDAAHSIHSIGEKLQVDAESLSALDEEVADADTITIDGSEAYWGIDHHTVEGVGTSGMDRLETPTLGSGMSSSLSLSLSDKSGGMQTVAHVEGALARVEVPEVAHSTRAEVIPRQPEDATRCAVGQDPWLGEALQPAKALSGGNALPSAEVLGRVEPAHFRIGGSEDSRSESSMSYRSSEEDRCADGFTDVVVAAPLTSMSSSQQRKGAGQDDLHILQQRVVHNETVGAAQQSTKIKEPRCLEFVATCPQSPLGLKLSWPPGKVEVLAIVQGGWADLAGIWEGAEIVSVNSERVAAMQEAELKELLRLRPLQITVAPEKQEIESVAPTVSAQVAKGVTSAISEGPSSSSEMQAGSIRPAETIDGPTAGAFASHNASARQLVQVTDRV